MIYFNMRMLNKIPLINDKNKTDLLLWTKKLSIILSVVPTDIALRCFLFVSNMILWWKHEVQFDSIYFAYCLIHLYNIHIYIYAYDMQSNALMNIILKTGHINI